MEHTGKCAAECEFDCTEGIHDILTGAVVISVLVLSVMLCLDVRKLPWSVLAILFLVIGIIALMIWLKLGKGRLIANTQAVRIDYSFLSRDIPMEEITAAVYDVESSADRVGNIYYRLILKIKTKSGSVMFRRELNIEKDLPTNHPEKYKAMLDEHPMVKLCGFINENKGF